MTDLTELKRLAEAATPHPFKGVDDTAKRMLAAYADAETIISLIQRVEEAEAMLKQQDEDQSEMLLIAHLNGAADLKDWKERALKAESDAAFLNELTATPIAILQERSHEEGRLAGIEEAAKVADGMGNTFSFSDSPELRDLERAVDQKSVEIAQAIRALKDQPTG